MEIFLIKLLQFLLAISLLVLLHEGGHFFFSKLFGVRVEKFYMFFDPSIWKWDGSIFKWKPKKSDTTYGIGWLPLGGYCKISGMIDESFDTEQMKQPVQPWEFRSKPAWQRLLIMIGGVLVNFLLALFIYAMVLFTWGDTYLSPNDMTMGMKFNDEAKALGFKDGDILVGTDKKTFEKFDVDVYRDMTKANQIIVLRDGAQVAIPVSEPLSLLEMLKTQPAFARPFVPSEIDSVMAGTPASELGLKKGDHIVALNDKEIDSWNSFDYEMSRLQDAMTGAKTAADSLSIRTVTLAYQHGDKGETDTVAVQLTEDLRLGIIKTTLMNYYKETHREYGFFESLPAGIGYGWNVLRGYVGDLKYLFTSDGAKSLGGFGAIGSLFPAQWDWQMFWLMTAFLSIVLAFMNILPIPALDGGHVLFLLYEMITGKTPSEKFMIAVEYVGFGLIILLMLVANLNDVLRWLGYM